MVKKLLSALLLTVGAACCTDATAQDVALKTDLLSDAALNVNLGLEFKTAPKWSFDLGGQYNGWTLSDNKKWKHWMVQPEMRYWLCEAFTGNFFGLELHGGQYNVGNLDIPITFLGTNFHRLKDHRYEGWFAGAGLTWGHAWLLSTHWNIEVEVGVGWSYTRSDEYECPKCGKKLLEDKVNNYVGLTKTALNIVYVF